MPPLPESFEKYKNVWFEIKDDNLKEISGTDKFDDLENVNWKDTKICVFSI